MRHTTGEKYEIIRLVEGADLPVRHTLRELQVHRSTFYAGYRRYAEHGQAALAAPDQSPRELAWQLTDREGHFLSESSVYRILKTVDLIPSPAYIVLSAATTVGIRRIGRTSCGRPTSPIKNYRNRFFLN